MVTWRKRYLKSMPPDMRETQIRYGNLDLVDLKNPRSQFETVALLDRFLNIMFEAVQKEVATLAAGIEEITTARQADDPEAPPAEPQHSEYEKTVLTLAKYVNVSRNLVEYHEREEQEWADSNFPTPLHAGRHLQRDLVEVSSLLRRYLTVLGGKRFVPTVGASWAVFGGLVGGPSTLFNLSHKLWTSLHWQELPLFQPREDGHFLDAHRPLALKCITTNPSPQYCPTASSNAWWMLGLEPLRPFFRVAVVDHAGDQVVVAGESVNHTGTRVSTQDERTGDVRKPEVDPYFVKLVFLSLARAALLQFLMDLEEVGGGSQEESREEGAVASSSEEEEEGAGAGVGEHDHVVEKKAKLERRRQLERLAGRFWQELLRTDFRKLGANAAVYEERIVFVPKTDDTDAENPDKNLNLKSFYPAPSYMITGDLWAGNHEDTNGSLFPPSPGPTHEGAAKPRFRPPPETQLLMRNLQNPDLIPMPMNGKPVKLQSGFLVCLGRAGCEQEHGHELGSVAASISSPTIGLEILLGGRWKAGFQGVEGIVNVALTRAVMSFDEGNKGPEESESTGEHGENESQSSPSHPPSIPPPALASSFQKAFWSKLFTGLSHILPQLPDDFPAQPTASYHRYVPPGVTAAELEIIVERHRHQIFSSTMVQIPQMVMSGLKLTSEVHAFFSKKLNIAEVFPLDVLEFVKISGESAFPVVVRAYANGFSAICTVWE